MSESTGKNAQVIKIPKIEFDKFVEGYLKCQSPSAKERYLDEKLKIKTYVPYDIKRYLCNSIVNLSCTKKDVNGNIEYEIDSCKKHILYVFSIILAYTNITIGNRENTIAYDTLKVTGLHEEIFKRLPEDDISEFVTVLDMTYNDFLKNNYNTLSYVNKVINNIISALSKPLSSAIAGVANEVNKYNESHTGDNVVDFNKEK